MASDEGTSAGALIAVAAIGVGAILLLFGIAGAAGNWGSSTTYVVAPKPVSSAPATTPTTRAAGAETPSAFVGKLDGAVKNHDTAFLLSRLHPAVIARYGQAQCRTFVPQLDDRYVVVGPPSSPAQYAYTSDGKTTPIAGVVAVPVRITAPDGTVANQLLHTAKVGNTFRYFVDCGTPTG